MGIQFSTNHYNDKNMFWTLLTNSQVLQGGLSNLTAFGHQWWFHYWIYGIWADGMPMYACACVMDYMPHLQEVKNLLKKYVHPHGMSWFCSAESQCWSKAFDLWVDGPHAVKSFGFAWEYGTSVNPLVDYHFPVFKFGPFLGIYSFLQPTRTYCWVYIPLFTFVYIYIYINTYIFIFASHCVKSSGLV
jgi:hypothetical protein